MAYLPVGKENSTHIDLYFEDHGSGRPVVLIHGWPLSSRSWEKQLPALLEAGYRVITYDRRGFGNSSKPTVGYDYDTLTTDLDHLLTSLDLDDVTLVGFSMGGGEVSRYVATHGSSAASRVKQAVFMAAIPPYLLKTADNPQGVDAAVFDQIRGGIIADRPAFLMQFLQNFYSVDRNRGTRISDDVVQLSWNIAAGASPIGTLQCVTSWLTDFRADLKRFALPTLVIHGDDDRIVPLEVSGERTAQLVKGAQLVVVKGGPHGLNWTHYEEVNQALVNFLSGKQATAQKVA
jgi:non-heme chloroperoxidase